MKAVELEEETGWKIHSWFIRAQFWHFPPGAL